MSDNSLPDRVGVVTGASSGIGLYTAIGLARTGMRVVMAGRNRARTEAARRLVTERTGSDRVEIALADFSRLAEVRRLAEEVLAEHDRLDLLVNNAGLMSSQCRTSADGFELTFAVNHLAPFLLTNLLLDRLKASSPARIVTVASRAHQGQRLDLATLGKGTNWGQMGAYGRSKLCNILFTRELAARLAGSGVVATCLHPGVVATGIGQHGGIIELGWRLAKPFMIGPEKGAGGHGSRKTSVGPLYADRSSVSATKALTLLPLRAAAAATRRCSSGEIRTVKFPE